MKAIAAALLLLAATDQYDPKKTMCMLQQSMTRIDKHDQKTFKREQKEILEDSNNIHHLGYKVMANDRRGRDDEFLRLVGELVGHNRSLKNSALRQDYKGFERHRRSLKESCANCHKAYRKQSQSVR